jgi:[ribosomal protein S5]-alanine N-acetyltransferase
MHRSASAGPTDRARARASSQRPPGLGSTIAVGERIFLRRPTPRDRRQYLALRRRSVSFLRPWEPRPSAKNAAVRQFAAWLASARSGRNEKLLICSSEDGAILGAINLNEIVRGPAQSAYLGYWIGAPYAKQGYMTEALPLALSHAFQALGLHRVEANIMPTNRPSLALVKRAGFRCEGYSPRYLKIAGRWRDRERWALLAEDWQRGLASRSRARNSYTVTP